MLRGLWRLTWVEIKIFLREPLGAFGTLVPVIVFVVLGRITEYMVAKGGPAAAAAVARSSATRPDLPVLAAMLIALNAVLSLVSVVSIYREGGILKRLRATPLRPQTILTAQVNVKLFFTAVTVALMMIAGRRYIPPDSHLHSVSIMELRLPEPSVVTLVIRDGRTFVPTEDTQLKAGDELLIVTTRTRRDATERRLRAVTRRGPLAHWFEEYGEQD